MLTVARLWCCCCITDRAGPTFRVIFNIFRLWVPRSTRERFVLVREGDEAHHFFSPPPKGCGLSREQAPKELGGNGPSLEGDRFILRACERYDATARLPAKG